MKLISYATGITAVTALVIVSSVAGANAYLAFQPSALEAQAINISAQDAPVTSTTESVACQQEIAAAATRGTPDVESVITDQSSLQFEDQCVAAVLNPAVTTLGPTNPGSYMCVGKSAKLNVSVGGLITETATPDAAVPAGTCTAVACSSASASGQSNCFAADNLTSLTGSSVQQDLTAAQTAELSPDSGITSFTLNADGSIASESANTTDVLSSGVGDENLAGNSVSLDQGATSQAISAQTSGGVPSLGETQAVGAQPPEVTEVEATPPESPAPETSDVAANPTVPSTAGTPDAAPAASDASAPTQASASTGDTAPAQITNTGSNGPQATESTITYSQNPTADLPSADTPANVAPTGTSAPSENVFERFATTVQADTVNAFNDVRGFFGLSPIGEGPAPTVPATIGIRG